MEYNGYFIYPDKTGYAPKESKFSFFLDEGEMYCGSGESIEDCRYCFVFVHFGFKFNY